MCGIAGIIDLHSRPVADADLRKMTDAILHRGPDGAGFFMHENVGFGHRRLAIIDLSPAGHQPMHFFGLTITYNGEIYNYLELRQELEKEGMIFSTRTDTEVILAAYRHWGKDCVTHFNGMWAFAIYEKATQEVFFSRDRFGEKPLYYRLADGRFCFGSELRAIKAVAATAISPNDLMAARFLIFEQTAHFNETFYAGIFQLPAGQNMVLHVQTAKLQFTQYYTPQRLTTWQKLNEQDAAEALRTKLRQSISLRLRSDVAVGTCLSGGLDSAAIAAFASSLYSRDVQQSFTGITAGSYDAKKDETPFAQRVASSLGMAWKQCKPDLDAYKKAFDRVLQIQEEPFDSNSVVMQHFVMQLAQKTGLKVLLDGQGADELLLGYRPHLAWMIKSLPPWPAAKLALKSMNKYQVGAKDLLLLIGYHSNVARKRNRQLSRWPNLQKDMMNQLQDEAEKEAKLPKDLFTRQCNELSHRILPMLLRYEDKNAMAFSVETRLPFLDHQLVEFLLNIPASLKVQQGWSKYLLRKTMENNLPDDIVWRKGKIGFDAVQLAWPAMDANKFQQLLPWLHHHTSIPPFQSSAAMAWRMHNLAAWKQQHS